MSAVTCRICGTSYDNEATSTCSNCMSGSTGTPAIEGDATPEYVNQDR